MSCNFPIKAWQSTSADNRKLLFEKPITLKDARGFTLYRELEIPCGQCMGCRLQHSLDWAIRLMHENQMHKQSVFLTLTYNDENLPKDNSLHVEDMQLFFKRLRSRLSVPIRYFYCGEYGGKTGRPHYHAIIYGWSPPDLVRIILKDRPRKSPPLFISDFLSSVWHEKGYLVCASVDSKACAYVSKYVTKKMKGAKADEYYNGRSPEFCQMSRRPGIASDWWDRYKNDVLVKDCVIYGLDKKTRPPRFYDRRYDVENPGDLQRIKEARKLVAEVEQQRKYGKGTAGADRRKKALEVRENKTKQMMSLFDSEKGKI